LNIVGSDAVEVERALLDGQLSCPGCAGRLRPWGSATRDGETFDVGGTIERRRPRQGRSAGCAITHVLISTDCLLRRRDRAQVIGAALAAKASGLGHRRAGGRRCRCPRCGAGCGRFDALAEAVRVWFTVLAHDLDPMLAPLSPTHTPVGDAVEAVAVGLGGVPAPFTEMTAE